MAYINPGPAVTNNPNAVAVITPVNTVQNPVVQGANALRLIAVARGLSVAGLGDIPVQVINATTWAPVTVAITNSQVGGVSGSVAAATLSINSGPGVTGTSIRASAALTNNTAATAFIAAASATVNLALTAQTIYVNVTVAVAGGTVDLFIYGYDAS